MSKPKSTIERVKFIPERDLGEPAGELLEGEVLHSSEDGQQKIARTDNHSVYVIAQSDDKSYWEVVSTVFDIDDIKAKMKAASELMALFGFK